MDISTTETTRTAIGKPLQMCKQHQRSPDTTLCRKTNKNDKEDKTVTALFQLAVIMIATNSAVKQHQLTGKLLWHGFHTRSLKVVRIYSLKLFTAPLYPTLQ
jgi:hypothetical protein